jgi:hypothetical protein
MFEFLPTWVKALCGTGLMLFILFVGFYQTSKKAKKGTKPSGGGDPQN